MENSMFSSKNRVKFSKYRHFKRHFHYFRGVDTMSLNFCEKNIQVLSKSAENVVEGISYRFDAIDPAVLLFNLNSTPY